ncbi:MAG: rod shape-determining protein [Dehalococcoidia bacterium]|nr:rod shape-determining protein [Thermoflexaceae bacterium]MCK6565154.1 rod shape-determining protein [Dehalococcoidia bacterium]NUQ56303.1 rod shape-determining protein [Dehalococcoidia bacterium]
MAFELFAAKKAGIDLGTANILVYVKGQGIVVNEPSVVARHNRDNAIVAVGNEARAMQGRTPGSISVIRPMRDGVIADYLTTEAMLRYFIGIITGRFNLIRPEVMVTVPAGVTSVEQRAVRDAAEQAGARKPAHLVPEPLAAAIGARIPIGTARGNMVVNIGGGRTEAAVISLYGLVVSESVRMAGDRIDEAIVAYVRRRHNLVIGEKTAEEIKIAIGSALAVDEGLSTQVRGRDQLSGLPKTITLTSLEVAQAIQDCLGAIVQTVRATLEKTPPELASDVIDRGIVLTGGGALLRHMDELLTQETGVPCYVADNPLECVAIGAGIALDHLDVIKRSLPTEEENLVGLFPSPER